MLASAGQKLGDDVLATANNATAIGAKAKVAAIVDIDPNDVALGQGAAFVDGSVALGAGASVTATQTKGGFNVSATDAIAIGSNAQVLADDRRSVGDGGVAIGASAISQGGGIVIGEKAGYFTDIPNGPTYVNTDQIALGSGAGMFQNGQDNTSIGNASGFNIEGNNNFAAGTDSGTRVKGDSNYAIGTASGFEVEGDDNLALGRESGRHVSGDRNMALGKNAGSNIIYGSSNLALGEDAGNDLESAAYNVAIGMGAGSNSVNLNDSIAIGRFAGRTVSGDRNSAIGMYSGTNVEGSDNFAGGFGSGNSVQGDQNTSLGNSAGAGVIGSRNTAMGMAAGAGIKGNDNIAMGTLANAGIAAQLFGKDFMTAGDNNITIGSNAGSFYTLDTSGAGLGLKDRNGNLYTIASFDPNTGLPDTIQDQNGTIYNLATFAQDHPELLPPVRDNTVSLGNQAYAGANHAIALGNNSYAQAASSTAIGDGAISRLKDGVALGSGSVANTVAGQVGYLAGGQTDATWKGTLAAVSVGGVDGAGSAQTRQITNVAAGTTLTDAVNVAQLQAGLATVETH